MPQPWATIAVEDTPEGPLTLARNGAGEFLIQVRGRVLMSSAARRSEVALSTLALAALRPTPAPSVLIGGLGMGCTLRAALDALPERARVRVVELNPVVASWCRGPLAELTAGAVSDPRVEVAIEDVARSIAASGAGQWDAIVLDLYEGPRRATQGARDPFYGDEALRRTRRALAPGGVLAVWAEVFDAPFEAGLARAGFSVTTHRVPAGAGRAVHIVYVGVRGR
jgi:spermidine synthase